MGTRLIHGLRALWTCAASVLIGAGAMGQNCAQTSVGLTPISDLGAGLYLGRFEGGLYPGGVNEPPASHRAAGLAAATAVTPLTPAGAPSASGSYVLLSIGMSNTSQEFCCGSWTFMGRAAADLRVNTSHLVIVNGARGGQAADAWESPSHPNYDRIRDNVLGPRGLSEQQVRAVWVKVANRGPDVSLPDPGADAYRQVGQLGNIVRALKARYPNVEQVLLSSRIYAGYAATALNPEPYAYEGAFAVKWLIEAQMRQQATGQVDPLAGDLSGAPWLGWAAYLWADGLSPRGDGLTWACADFQNDGTHPSQSGEAKVGGMLLEFFSSSPLTRWFLACYADCDQSTGAGVLDVFDFLCFQDAFVGGDPYADCDGNEALDVFDFLCYQDGFVAGCP